MKKFQEVQILKSQDETFYTVTGQGARAIAFSLKAPDDRPLNEDTAYMAMCTPDTFVLVVADGMGGHKQGHLASEQVIFSLKGILRRSKQLPLRWRLLESAEEAHRKIQKLKLGAGSTIVGAVVERHSLYLISAGDSIATQVGGRGVVKYRTIEHSPSGFASESGLIEDQELLEENSHYISNALGLGPMRVEVSERLKLSKNDTLLLGSDGLFANVEDSHISEILRKGTVEEKAKRLLNEAKSQMSAGGQIDDLTFILYGKS